MIYLYIIIGFVSFISMINIVFPKFKINLNISWIYPFGLHPFYNVSRKHGYDYDELLEHETTHLKQQVRLTLIFFLFIYLYYKIAGMIKYGNKKSYKIYVGRMSIRMKRKLSMSYLYNPFETEAFIREDVNVFNKVYPEFKNRLVTGWSHRNEIYKSALTN